MVTEDKMVAVIEQGIELPYQVATSSGATSITFKKANLRLEVTPQITPDGNVVLEVDVNKDSKGEETARRLRDQHPAREDQGAWSKTAAPWSWAASTSRPSATTRRKVPLLGDVPVLGYLFKTTGAHTSKTELLVFITPKIVADRVSAR